MKKIYLLFPILAGIMFGSTGIFVRTLTENGVDSTTLLFLRFSIAILYIVIAIFLTDKSLFKINKEDIPLFVLCGLCILGLNLCYNSSINTVPLSLAAILLSTAPVFVLVLEYFLFKEKITSIKVLCVIFVWISAMTVPATGAGSALQIMTIPFKENWKMPCPGSLLNRSRSLVAAEQMPVVEATVRFAPVVAQAEEEKPVPAKYYLSDVYVETLRRHKARHESKGNGFGYEIIEDNEVANAIVVGGMGRERNLVRDHRLTNFTPVTNIKGEINREGIRRMTPREWARLQGFPDDFVIGVADASAYKQFGNSVAVPAIQATAEKIVSSLKL